MSETNNTELVKLQPIVADEAELQQLKQDYEKLVVTEDNLEEADKARLKLKNKRLDIQRLEKANDDLLKKLRTTNSGKADALVAIIEPVEKRLETEVKNIKTEQERKRKEAEDKGKERIKKHKEAIQVIHVQTARLALSTNIPEMKANIEGLKEIVGSFEEFETEFQEAAELYTAAATQRIELLELKAKQEEDAKKKEAETTTTEPLPEVKSEIPTIEQPTEEKQVTQTELFPHEQRGEIIYKSISLPVNFSYGGFDFHIPVNIPETDRNKILDSIRGIVDEIEIA